MAENQQFANELAPNTTARHQGRMAYLAEHLVQPEVAGPILDKAQESALVTRVGRSVSIGDGGTIIPINTVRPEAGQAGALETTGAAHDSDNAPGASFRGREGQRAPLSGIAYSKTEMYPVKLSVIVTASKEMVASNGENGLWSQIQRDLSGAIARAADLAAFHGRNAQTGTPILNANMNGKLVDLTASPVIYLQGGTGNLEDKLIAGYDAVLDAGEDFSGFAVHPRYRSKLVTAKDSQGNALFHADGINLNSPQGSLLGLPAQYGRVVGGDSVPASTDTGVRLVGGDLGGDGKLLYGFASNMTVDVDDRTTIVDANQKSVPMWQTGQVAIKAEVSFGWLVADPSAFALYVDAEEPSEG